MVSSGKSWPLIKRSNLILIFVFAIIIGFWQINGFRMYTAAHLFFFGAIQYLIDNKKMGIAIAAMSIFFHYSFIFPTALLLVFIALPRKAPWFYWIFVITFFISEVNIPILTDNLTRMLPGVFHQRIEGYTSDVYIDAVAGDVATRNWRYSFYSQSIKWVATGFLSVIYFFGRNFLKGNKNYNTLFCFALLFMASVNMVTNIPSMSSLLFSCLSVYIYLPFSLPTTCTGFLLKEINPGCYISVINILLSGHDQHILYDNRIINSVR